MAATDLAEQAVAHGALQKVSELAWLTSLIQERSRPRRILEIGSWEAGTLWLFHQLAGEVWSIDPRPVPHRDWMDDRVHLVTGRSAEALHLVPDAFDLVFIDGDHSTPAVNADWDLYSPLVDMVAIHDIAHWDPTPEEIAQGYGERGVEELWRRIRATHTTVEYLDPAPQEWPDGRSIDHREGGIGVVFMERQRA